MTPHSRFTTGMDDDWEDEMIAADKIPDAFKNVKVGDWLTVKKEMFGRGGQSGVVLDIMNSGANLDFYTCGLCGQKRCGCFMSTGHWEWDEIEPMEAPTTGMGMGG